MKRQVKKIREKLFRRKVSVCGSNLNVFGRVWVCDGKSIRIGDNFRVNDGVRLIGREGSSITIGNDVTISANSMILCSGYDVNRWFLTNEKVHVPMHTVIGDHIWICANAVVNGGVKITGKYVVIASGSGVKDDIHDSYCIYAGNPARMVKQYRIANKQEEIMQ